MGPFAPTANSMRWHTLAWGEPDAPLLVLLHGFTGCGAFWTPVAELLSSHWRVLAPDLPGHGETPAPSGGLAEAADELAADLAALRRPVTLVGYSLGGRIALHLAVQHPQLLERLVLIGASPGLEREEDREARRASDARWARMLREEGQAPFLAAWEAQPLFASQQTLSAGRREWLRALREMQCPEGLAKSLEAFGLGAQAPLHEALSGIDVPTWLVVGDDDAKFKALAAAMAQRLPQATVHAVAGCGHNVPLERPEALLSLLGSFTTRSKV